MGQFAPEILFTDPTMANQFVRLSDLNEAAKNRQQQMAMAALQHERQQQNQLGYQYAALANQQRAQDLADQRAQAELASRERMFGQQLDLNKEMARLNPYGKSAGDIYLGGAQLNNNIDEGNATAEAEAAALNEQLKGLDLSLDQSKAMLPNQVSNWRKALGAVGVMDSPEEFLQQKNHELYSDYLTKKNALLASAKRSRFNPQSNQFEPIRRQGLGMPGTVNATTASPLDQTATATAATPRVGDVNQYQSPPVGLDLNSGVGGLGGTPQFQRIPWLDNPSTVQPPSSGTLGTADQMQRLKDLYAAGKISDQDFLTQYDLIK